MAMKKAKFKKDSAAGVFTMSNGVNLLFNTYTIYLLSEKTGKEFSDIANEIGGGLKSIISVFSIAAQNGGMESEPDEKVVCGWIDAIGGLASDEFIEIAKFIGECYGRKIDETGEMAAG